MFNNKLNKINKIIKVLIKHPEGIWLRYLAKETKIPPATLYRYLERELEFFIENVGIKNKKGRYFGLRVVRLKPKIREAIEKEGLKKVYKYLEIYSKL